MSDCDETEEEAVAIQSFRSRYSGSLPKDPPMPYGRIRTPNSSVEDSLRGIATDLWSELRFAFTAAGLPWQESAQFVTKPSRKLESLYRICFGEKWADAVFELSTSTPMTSVDVFVALAGAAIHSDVFLSVQSWELQEIMTFQSELHRRHAIDELGRQGNAAFETTIE